MDLRRQPYRLFFPLGAGLGALGVGYWLLYTSGVSPTYSGDAHASAQLQGFLPAFACGFLFTMLPRRTQTSPVSWAELALAAMGVSAATVAALSELWLACQAAYLLTLVVLMRFAVPRARASRSARRAPDAFVLIPIALLSGVIGAALVVLQETGRLSPVARVIGDGLLTQGVFLCLTLGVGSMVLPLLCGHETPPDGTEASHGARLAHALAGLAVLSSFPLQAMLAGPLGATGGSRAGFALRLAAVLAVMLAARAWRRPVKPGSQRMFVWLSAWLVPAGLALALVDPRHAVPFLHVTFVGGFALMALSVGCHVILAHGGFDELVHGRPWPVRTFGLLVLASMAIRVSADFLDETYFMHLGIAAVTWLAALLAWCAFLLPKALVRARS